MDYFLVLLQGLIALVCFLAPGLAILNRLSPRDGKPCPLAYRLSAAFALSSLVIVVLQFAFLSLLGPTFSRYAAWLILPSCALYMATRGPRIIQDELSRLSRPELIGIQILLACFVLWLLAMPLSPYPSQLTLGLGDTPAYFALARDLVQGLGWVQGYFAGDYPNGVVSYITLQPAPALITSFLFQIFGVNSYSLYVYDALASLLLAYLAASFACAPDRSSPVRGTGLLFILVAFLLAPAYFLFSSLGVVTMPGSIMFLIAASLSTTQLVSLRGRIVSVVASLVMMVILRPEGALLAVLFVICWLPVAVRRNLTGRIRAGYLLVLTALCVIAFSATWFALPDLMRAMPTTIKGFAVYNTRFDPTKNAFEPLYLPWTENNRRIAQANFSGQLRLEDMVNSEIGHEIQSHPWEFLRYLLAGYTALARTLLVETYWLGAIADLDMLSAVVSSVIVAIVLLIAAAGTRLWWLMGTILLLLILGPLLNQAFSGRHLMVVSPAIAGLFLRSIIPLARSRLSAAALPSGRPIQTILVGLGLALLLADYCVTVGVRLDPRNQTYNSIFRDIDRLTSPSDVIASTYPQLIYYGTGRRSVGTTWLIENAEPMVDRFQPDFILVDRARLDATDYFEAVIDKGWTIKDYQPVFTNTDDGYVLFQKETALNTSLRR